jgi:hypothetical protein|nr:MAG TPA: hypothetical protein [Caudoviricetes sp.]
MLTAQKIENIMFKVTDHDKNNKMLCNIILDLNARRVDFTILDYASSLDSDYGMMWTGDKVKGNCPKAVIIHHLLKVKCVYDSTSCMERKIKFKEEVIDEINKYIKEAMKELGYDIKEEDPLFINYNERPYSSSVKYLIEQTDFYETLVMKNRNAIRR